MLECIALWKVRFFKKCVVFVDTFEFILYKIDTNCNWNAFGFKYITNVSEVSKNVSEIHTVPKYSLLSNRLAVCLLFGKMYLVNS